MGSATPASRPLTNDSQIGACSFGLSGRPAGDGANTPSLVSARQGVWTICERVPLRCSAANWRRPFVSQRAVWVSDGPAACQLAPALRVTALLCCLAAHLRARRGAGEVGGRRKRVRPPTPRVGGRTGGRGGTRASDTDTGARAAARARQQQVCSSVHSGCIGRQGIVF